MYLMLKMKCEEKIIEQQKESIKVPFSGKW